MKKIKVMIIEDEMVTAMSIKMELENIGYEICGLVNSGEKAIASLDQENPNVVLMDINLKGKIDGIEAAIKLRDRQKLPIIFLSGNDDEETRKRASVVKPIAYLNKPTEIDDLKQAIDKAYLVYLAYLQEKKKQRVD